MLRGELHTAQPAVASALTRHEIRPGDVVATLLPNIPAQAEAHFAVPATGAILNTINTRLDPETVAYIFGRGGAKMILVDSALLPLAEAAIKGMEGPALRIIEVPDLKVGHTASGHYLDYEALLVQSDPTAPLANAGG